MAAGKIRTRDVVAGACYVLLLIAFMGIFLWLNASGKLISILEWVSSHGAAGVPFCIAFIMLTATPLPISFVYLLTQISCGFLYGKRAADGVAAGGGGGEGRCLGVCLPPGEWVGAVGITGLQYHPP